jgi:hypothetical protein
MAVMEKIMTIVAAVDIAAMKAMVVVHVLIP